MKTSISLFLLVFSIGLFAQNLDVPNFEIFEATRDFSESGENALVMELPGYRERFVDNVWEQHIKDNGGRARRERSMKGNAVKDFSVFDIYGHEKFDLYYRFSENKGSTELVVWINSAGTFLKSDHSLEAYQGALRFMQAFGLKVRIAEVEEMVKAEEKSLKDIESTYSKLQKDNEGYHKDIEKAKDAIKKAEEQIAQNVKDQAKTQEDIKNQRIKLEEVQQRLGSLKK